MKFVGLSVFLAVLISAVLFLTNVASSILPKAEASTYGCVSLTQDLSYGLYDYDTNGQVSELQQFLIDQDLLAIVAPTGNFGSRTKAAVSVYQSINGLSVTGVVSSDTRAKIQQQTCGTTGTQYQYQYSNTTDYTYSNTTVPGCLAGYAFSTLTGQSCYVNTYTSIPGCLAGYMFSSLTGQSCSTNSYNYNYQYNYNINPTITSISPTTGVVGSSITIYGTGFSTQNNTVYFGTIAVDNISSYNGTSITVNVPTGITQNTGTCLFGYCGYGGYQQTYTSVAVSVKNANGYTSNSTTYNVSGTNGYNYGSAPIITNVTGPTNLSAGTSGTWTFTLNDPSNSYVTASVRWGDEGNYTYATLGSQTQQSIYASGQQTVSFTHTYQTSGYYTVVFTVRNSSGQENTSTLTVNISGNTYSQPTLSYLSPSQGRIGTQIALQGTGFASYGNTVRFGIGGAMNLPSTSGTTIYFTVPYSLSSCDVAVSGYCTALAPTQVIPGVSYPVYVTTPSGITNTLYFNVTSY